ncbi:MAG: A/G-specific adenine glycosylase [Desulfuromonadales bacterium]|nr:A/G-specific adenine glycosylase [Desulfuromonadales bacterium]
MSECSCPAEDISSRLLAWYRDAGRALPWRNTRDPYCIWLSEIMLQQTTVEAVIPYYERFLANFSSVAALAAAPLDSVLDLWAGLGYYSRARNLHKAARMVVEDFCGEFPADLAELQRLPGIGRSTAGAIRSIAFDLPGPILDGNVRRVLCRLHAVTTDPRASATEKQLWQRAESLTSVSRPHDYAQAIMDLGATLCTPRQPRCPLCPLRAHCQAFAQSLQGDIPVRHKKPPVPKRAQVVLLLEDQRGARLVRKRPYDGMLGGLWEFPAAPVEAGETTTAVISRLLATLGVCSAPEPVGVVKHVYSHFALTCTVFRCRVSLLPQVAKEEDRQWVPPTELAALALHGAHQKVLKLVTEKTEKDKM